MEKLFQQYHGVWRIPPEESPDIYPGLVVDDGRVSGSITAGRTRLPLWAFIFNLVTEGTDRAWKGWEVERTGLTQEMLGSFLYHLLEMRGEFGRLLLTLANAERNEDETPTGAWWEDTDTREQVRIALQACIDALDAEATPPAASPAAEGEG